MPEITFSDREESSWQKSGVTNFPDGNYSGKLTEARIAIIGRDNRKVLILEYEIKTPTDYAGCIYAHFNGLTEEAFGFTKSVIAWFGIDPGTKLSNLQSALDNCIEANLSFNLVTSESKNGKQYQNCKIADVSNVAFGGNDDDMGDESF